MTDPDLQRWAELVDRETAGEVLTPAQRRFCAAVEARSVAAEAEATLLAQLGNDVDDPPDAAAHAMVAHVLLGREGMRDDPYAPSDPNGPDGGARIASPREATTSQPAQTGSADAQVDVAAEDRGSSGSRGQGLGGSSTWRRRGAVIGLVVAASAAAVALLALLPRQEYPAADAHSAEGARATAGAGPTSPGPQSPLARPPRAELVYVSGVVRRGQDPATVGAQVLRAGELVETAQGHACILLDPHIDLCLGADTRLRIDRLSAPERRVELLSGEVMVSLRPLPPGTHFSVAAAGVVSTAVGTVFNVRHAPEADAVETTVLEGEVAVSSAAGRSRVHAHQRLRQGRRPVSAPPAGTHGARTDGQVDPLPGRPLTAEPVSRVEEAGLRARLQVRPIWHAEAPALLEVSAPSGLVHRVFLDGALVGRAPLSMLVPAGRRVLRWVAADGRQAAVPVSLQPGQRLKVPLSPLSEGSMPVPAARPGPPPEPQTSARVPAGTPRSPDPAEDLDRLLHRARTRLLSRDYAGAARAYQRALTRHAGDRRVLAVRLSLAELQLQNLSAPERALSHFDGYLRQGGPLAREARHGRVRALRALGRYRDEAEAIADFLARHRHSPHRQALLRRAAAIAELTPKKE